MKRFNKLGVTLFVMPLVFSCATGTNNGKSGIKKGINEQCSIDLYCENCYFAIGANPDESIWREKDTITAPIGERLEVYFKAKGGYSLPQGIYSIREKETGTDIDEYVFRNESDYKKLIFTPTASTVIQMIADYDCVDITWSTTANDEQVGFSYNGGLNFVDWGDGVVNNESRHVYKIGGSYTAKISGNINSIMVGTNNPITNLYYEGNQDIKEIKIKNTITTIPTGAFSNLINLEKMSIANSVTNIKNRSFNGCNALKDIKFEEDNPTYKSFNGSDIVNTSTETLIYCNSNDKIDSSITKIGDYAFEGSTIKNIAIPKNVVSIGSMAFSNCVSLKTLDLTDYETPPAIASDSLPDSIVSIQTADEKVAWMFGEAWEDLPLITDKITYPSTGEFQILPLEDGKLTLTGVPATDADCQPLQFYIKNYNVSNDWVGPFDYSAPQGSESKTYNICEVKANKPVAIKSSYDNVTLSTVADLSTESSVSSTHWTFSCSTNDDADTIPYNVSGRLLSLIKPEYLDEYNPQTMPDDVHFSYLFDKGLIDASNLVMASTVKQACYIEMFKNCTSLENAPKLPCDDLNNYSANFCYHRMFYNCTSLINAPELPSTTTTDYCYSNMFHGCTSLTIAPNLPAKILNLYTYIDMFASCTSLVNPPIISATQVNTGSCLYMFTGCEHLESTPNLSALSLGVGCYSYMFNSCSALKKCCELPAINLRISCYASMFKNCTSLIEGPKELPATTMENSCYDSMFYGCSKLAVPPIIKATTYTSASKCFNAMFTSCKALRACPGESGTVFFDSTGFETTQMGNMFSTTGGTATATPTANTKYSYLEHPCLGFTSSNSAYLSYEIIGSLPNIHIQTSTDLLNWTDWDGSSIGVPINTSIYVRNLSNTLSTSENSYFHFVTNNAYLKVTGFLDSLINFAPLSDYCYYKLFENFKFPSTTTLSFGLPSLSLGKYCYCSMFEGATGFMTAPDLPATTLAEGCYMNMFKNQTKLVIGALNTKFGGSALEPYSCYGMFEGCSALTAQGVSMLKNVVSLADHSCERMCYNCAKVKVGEEFTTIAKLIFTCPSTATLVDPVKDMFVGTAGAFTGTPTAGNSYYR